MELVAKDKLVPEIAPVPEVAAIDFGHGHIKGCIGGKEIMIPAIFADRRELKLRSLSEDIISTQTKLIDNLDVSVRDVSTGLTYEYFIGRLAYEEGGTNKGHLWDNDKTGPKGKAAIAVTLALASINKPGTNQFHLIMNLPVAQFHEPYIMPLKKKLPGIYEVTFHLGRGKSITTVVEILEEVRVMVQGTGFIVEHLFGFPKEIMEKHPHKDLGQLAKIAQVIPYKGEFPNEHISVIDIGYRSTEVIVLNKNLKEIDAISDGFDDLGVRQAHARVKAELEKHGVTYSLESIDKVFREKRATMLDPDTGVEVPVAKESLEKLIDKALREMVNAILAKLQVLWSNKEQRIDIIIIAGGGGLLAEKHLKQALGKTTPKIFLAKNPVMGNAIGLWLWRTYTLQKTGNVVAE